MMSQADILFPEREIQINNTPVIVREFSYLQGMQMAAKCRELIGAICKNLSDSETLMLSVLDCVIADHVDEWVLLLSQSIERDADFVRALNDQDGSNLAMAFWEINGPFLLRRVMLNRVFQKTLKPV